MTRLPARCIPSHTLLFLATLAASGCFGDDPSGPEEPPMLEALASRGGDVQFAEPGMPLEEPLEVLVRDRSDGRPEGEVRVVWERVEGPGGSLSRTDGLTDDAGRASTRFTVGSEPARYRIRARFPDVQLDPVEFHARSVVPPTLDRIEGAPVVPGSVVTLEGSGFVPEIEDIDVLFSGFRAEVLEGSGEALQVRVPDCLNEPRVTVSVALGPVRAHPLEVDVEGRGTSLDLEVGDLYRIDDPEARSCVLLSGGSDEEYLAMTRSTSATGGMLHEYAFLVRAPDGDVASFPAASAGPARLGSLHGVGTGRTAAGAPDDAMQMDGEAGPGAVQERWDEAVRRLEAEATADGGGPRPARAAPAPATVPEEGEARIFTVLNGSGGFDTVRAVARVVSEEAVLYLDEEAADGSFEDGDLRTLGAEFDDPIHPTLTGAFGEASDIDGNQRIIILFTPVVNRLTEDDSDGFVGGFFYGVDLLPDREGSNAGEVFYALVPDPDGTHGPARSRDEVVRNIPAILAHEFQHMIHFNQRVLVGGAPRTDALWLSEALATTAEDLVAEAWEDRGDSGTAEQYRSGNYIRAREFLESTRETSLVVHAGSGTLAERGAGWLFLKHLRDHDGEEILRAMTQTTRTGVANVTATVAEPWAALVEPWAAALYLDHQEAPVPPRYRFTDFRIRQEMEDRQGYPLQPPRIGDTDVSFDGRLRSSSAGHAIVVPATAEGIALNLAGRRGGALPPLSGLALLLVRLQ